MEKAQEKLDKFMTSYNKTVVDFEIEKAAKEARELEAATKEALAEFETRSAERKT